MRLHAPDRIQRRLEFEECSGGRDDEGDAADNGGDDPTSALTRSLEKTLHRPRAFASDELIELADNFPADGIGAEDHSRDRGSDGRTGAIANSV